MSNKFNIDDNSLIDQKTCPICFNESNIIDDSVKTINKKCDANVSLRECNFCKHWWIDPMPKQEGLSKWYKEGSNFVVATTDYSGTSPDDSHSKKIFLRLTNYINKSKFNYLEIGCGTGNLLKYFSSVADVSYGVEPGWWSEDSDLKVVKDIDDLPLDAKFDIIVLSDVLEHVADPDTMIEKVAKVANPEAIISLNFPNKDSLKAKIKKGKWGMVLPFGHLNFFSSKSIDYICEKNDLKIIKKKAIRAGNQNTADLLKMFDLKNPKISPHIIKSILIGKDQWDIILKK